VIVITPNPVAFRVSAALSRRNWGSASCASPGQRPGRTRLAELASGSEMRVQGVQALGLVR
jgi:hypothetical protein